MTRPAWMLVGLALLACRCTPDRIEWENTYGGAGEDLFLVDDDLACLADDTWTKIGTGAHVANLLGRRDEALAVAGNPAGGGTFPVGTVISLFPDEAMVKRGAGFDADTHDWEFLTLHIGSGRTVITSRGTTEVANFVGTCIGCHQKADDFVCFTDVDGQGCDPFPGFVDTDVDPATEDPRCR